MIEIDQRKKISHPDPEQTKAWGDNFVASLNYGPDSQISRLANRGVKAGVLENSDHKEAFARKAGAVFAHIFKHDTGGEYSAEEIDTTLLSEGSGISPEIATSILALMVEADIIRSSDRRRWVEIVRQATNRD